MNKDIRILTSWRSHRKKKKLIMALGPQAVVSWIDLLLSVAENRPEGKLIDMSIEDIALDAEWPGDPDSFVKVLSDLRLLDQRNGYYEIHDWKDHNPYVFYAKERSERARKAAQVRWGKDDSMLADAKRMPLASSSNAPSPSPAPSPLPTPKDKSLSKDKQPPVASSSTKHFSENISETYLEPLLDIAKKLQGKSNGRKGFNCYAWIQRHSRKKSHPGAMLKALEALFAYWKSVKDPVAYLEGIMKSEHQNFNEKDYVQSVEILKKEIHAWQNTPQGKKIIERLHLKKV